MSEIEQLETIAIKSVALKDMEYFHRKICRYYSQNFHTPLLEVYDLPWPFVFTNYIEHVLETTHGKEGIYNFAIEICYPERMIDDEEEFQKVKERIEAEEEARRQKEKAKLEAKKKEEEENPPEDEPDINMKSTSFSHLDEEMEEES
tara:strand:+ start:9115 stop:9555 length:441 start_codon:yes stop_codon:yes gene_type:complete